jgi:hypothetical protein
MFSTFLKELGGYFDKSWLVSAFFPSLLFWSAGLLFYATVRGLGTTLALWRSQSTEMQWILIASGLASITFFAYVIGNFQTGLIRFFEGYWQTYPLVWLRDSRLYFYQRRLQYLRVQVKNLNRKITALKNSGTDSNKDKKTALKYNRQFIAYRREYHLFFPGREDLVMPTRLGNILRASEDYASLRYSIDSVVIWPRLYFYLPDTFIANLTSAETAMTTMLVMAGLSFTFAVIACLVLALFTTKALLFAICASGFFLAWLCYRNSLHSARLYAELIKSAFDLHRWELLEAMHVKLPATLEEERKIWDDVTQLILRNIDFLNARYTSEESSEKSGVKDVFTSALDSIKVISGALSKSLEPEPVPVLSAEQTTPSKDQNTTSTGFKVAGSIWNQILTRWRSRPRDLLVPSYFIFLSLLCIIALSAMSTRVFRAKMVFVAKADIPIHHLITSRDLDQKILEAATLPENALTQDDQIADHYTLQALSKGAVLTSSQVEAPQDATSVIIGIPATSSMALGGTLNPGDHIDVMMTKEGVSGQSPPPPLYERLLVVDIKSTPDRQSMSDKPLAYPFVITISLPASLRQRFATDIAGARLQITREP